MQHRGGPEGLVRVLDDRTLGFADFSGNKQYITVGNLLDDDRVALFVMEYADRARLKLSGRADVIGADDEARLQELVTPGFRARVERGLLIRVEAFDWNCPQHIARRFTETEAAVSTLRARIAKLEAELAAISGARRVGEAARSALELAPVDA